MFPFLFKKQPYVYKWDIGGEGYTKGFQMSFEHEYFGTLDQAKCIIWASLLNDFCLECFNWASHPEKVAIVCQNGSYGQYEVKQKMKKKDYEEI